MNNNRIEVQHLSPEEFERTVRRQVEKAFENHIDQIEDLKRLTRETRGVLNRQGVMDYLGVKEDALRRYETELGLPSHCPGGKVKYYLVDEIKEWIREHPGEVS